MFYYYVRNYSYSQKIHNEVFRRKEICILHTFKWLRKIHAERAHEKEYGAKH